MNTKLNIWTSVLFFAAFGAACSEQKNTPFENFLHAVAQVESNHNDNAVGDGGASIGRYQIQWAYWKDAVDYDRSIGGAYEDVKDKAYAERIMHAYFKRYARQAVANNDFETLARIHNGGPRGHKRKSTLPYWVKVKAALKG